MATVVYRREPPAGSQPGDESESDPTDADGAAAGSGVETAADGGREHAQGYIGEWEWRFKDTASEATRIAVLTAAQFAAFAGVGRHNARGAGCVETDILGVDR